MAFPKIHFVICERTQLDLGPENDTGHIEYKRCLTGKKCQKYATQMLWRISQHRNKCAVYYIGVDDNGDIHGLTADQIVQNIQLLIDVMREISARMVRLKIIIINHSYVIQATVKAARQEIEALTLDIFD